MESNIQYFPSRQAVKEPVFSIMIPTWNNLPYLKLCIESIREHSSCELDVILHVNEGKDGTLEWVQAQPAISFCYSRQNVGVCHAMNAMRTLARADYLLYLNDDMYVLPGWDRHLKEEIDRLPDKYFFLSATAIEPRAQSACSIGKSYGRTLETFENERLLKEFNDLTFDDWQGATWPPNVVHKDLWDAVGGYSLEFSPGIYSDPDFSMKLWQQGVRLFKGVAKSRVYHFGSLTVKRVKQNKGYYTFIEKWGMTSSTLSKYYLQRGKPFDGPLVPKRIPLWVHVNNFYHRLTLPFRSQ